jgi:hypothetical protein
MQQVKLFKGVESEIDMLEAEVNKWISTSGAKVIQIAANIAPQSILPNTSGTLTTGGSSQRFAPSDLFISVLYEDS